jgi:predicted peptidase
MKKTLVAKSPNNLCGYIVFEPIEPSKGVVIFQHGRGEGGEGTLATLPRVLTHGLAKRLNDPTFNIPYVVICPQSNIWGWIGELELTGKDKTGAVVTSAIGKNIFDIAKDKYGAKPENTFMTGLSAGGYGSILAACIAPERLRAIIPVCPAGWYDATKAANIKIPVKTYHSKDDGTSSYPDSLKFTTLINSNGGKAELVTTTGDHAGAWNFAYNDPNFFKFVDSLVTPVVEEPPVEPEPEPKTEDRLKLEEIYKNLGDYLQVSK